MFIFLKNLNTWGSMSTNYFQKKKKLTFLSAKFIKDQKKQDSRKKPGIFVTTHSLS